MDEEKIRKYVKYQEEHERMEEDSELHGGLFYGPIFKPPALQVLVDFLVL